MSWQGKYFFRYGSRDSGNSSSGEEWSPNETYVQKIQGKGWCKIDLKVALTQLRWRITIISLVICSLGCNLHSTSTVDLSLILTMLLWGEEVSTETTSILFLHSSHAAGCMFPSKCGTHKGLGTLNIRQ